MPRAAFVLQRGAGRRAEGASAPVWPRTPGALRGGGVDGWAVLGQGVAGREEKGQQPCREEGRSRLRPTAPQVVRAELVMSVGCPGVSALGSWCLPKHRRDERSCPDGARDPSGARGGSGLHRGLAWRLDNLRLPLCPQLVAASLHLMPKNYLCTLSFKVASTCGPLFGLLAPASTWAATLQARDFQLLSRQGQSTPRWGLSLESHAPHPQGFAFPKYP